MPRSLATSFVLAALLLAPSLAFAGSSFSGWGNSPREAMRDAIDNAVKNSKGGCLCKGWNMDIETQCNPSEKLGGFVCNVCGSNNKGSCKKGSEFERLKDDLGL